MSIANIVERARKEPPYFEPNASDSDSPYVCKVFDQIRWDKQGIERLYGFELPNELAELWDACGGMLLYGDDLWVPWGLLVCSPTEESLVRQNNRYQKVYDEWVAFGDLVIAALQSIGEPVLMRCDKDAEDYGSIIVVVPGDERFVWYKAASSLEEFLTRYMDARGNKYWEYHYQKALAEKAAHQNTEGK